MRVSEQSQIFILERITPPVGGPRADDTHDDALHVGVSDLPCAGSDVRGRQHLVARRRFGRNAIHSLVHRRGAVQLVSQCDGVNRVGLGNRAGDVCEAAILVRGPDRLDEGERLFQAVRSKCASDDGTV